MGVEPEDLEDNVNGGVKYLGMLAKDSDELADVAAMYNAGPGNVKSAMKRCKSTEFIAYRPCLPKETAHYVPKVFAARRFFR